MFRPPFHWPNLKIKTFVEAFEKEKFNRKIWIIYSVYELKQEQPNNNLKSKSKLPHSANAMFYLQRWMEWERRMEWERIREDNKSTYTANAFRNNCRKKVIIWFFLFIFCFIYFMHWNSRRRSASLCWLHSRLLHVDIWL